MQNGSDRSSTPRQGEILDAIATLLDAQEAALDRGHLFEAVLLSAVAPPTWSALTPTLDAVNRPWAAALHDHADTVETRIDQQIAAATARRARRTPHPPPSTPGQRRWSA